VFCFVVCGCLAGCDGVFLVVVGGVGVVGLCVGLCFWGFVVGVVVVGFFVVCLVVVLVLWGVVCCLGVCGVGFVVFGFVV
ncbi:hypothetical protein ABTJ98_21665, partial [Acinetobacter baumannii]